MSTLFNTERIDRELFKATAEKGKVVLTISNTILLGKKGANDVKLDSIYTRSYNSQKYSTHSELDNIKISTSDYITFSYNDFINKENEEIFISYPNLYDLKTFINECFELMMNDEVFTKNNDVSVKYKDFSITSEKFASDKIIMAIPTTIERNDFKERGMFFLINNENFFFELDIKGIYTMNEIIGDLNLLNSSNQTLIIGLLNGNGSNSSETNNSISTRRPPRSPLSNRKGTSSFSNSRKFKTEKNDEETPTTNNKSTNILKRRNTPKPPEVEVNDDENIFPEYDDKDDTSKNDEETSTTNTSLNQILEEADKIDFKEDINFADDEDEDDE